MSETPISHIPGPIGPIASTHRVDLLVSDLPSAETASGPDYAIQPYNPQRQYDYVRTVVTVGLLALLAFVIVWVAIESSASDDVWKRTKEMLQIVLPALTALIGSALGFYFGTQRKNNSSGD